MKIVITGATGHIGSFLARDFANQFDNLEIIMIDNLLTQRFPSLFNLPDSVIYSFIEADITEIDLIPVLKDADFLIHLAAITDAAGSFDKAELVERNNFQATLKVAEACLRTNTSLVVLSSTSVYGTQNRLVAEDCMIDELKPQSPYAMTKLKEERLISSLVEKEGLKALICRFGTIFGTSPGMRFHTAVNKFCWQAVMCQPITVWKTAYDQKRPYLDIFDASRAIAFIIKNDLFDGGIYNILTHNLTVRNVVEAINIYVPELNIDFVENKIMNQMSYEVSNDKFIAKGFKFQGDIKKGIENTVNILRRSNKAF